MADRLYIVVRDSTNKAPLESFDIACRRNVKQVDFYGFLGGMEFRRNHTVDIIRFIVCRRLQTPEKPSPFSFLSNRVLINRFMALCTSVSTLGKCNGRIVQPFLRYFLYIREMSVKYDFIFLFPCDFISASFNIF